MATKLKRPAKAIVKSGAALSGGTDIKSKILKRIAEEVGPRVVEGDDVTEVHFTVGGVQIMVKVPAQSEVRAVGAASAAYNKAYDKMYGKAPFIKGYGKGGGGFDKGTFVKGYGKY